MHFITGASHKFHGLKGVGILYINENIKIHGGSACPSGTDAGSHVISAINNNPNQITVRFSFSKYNTKDEVEVVVGKLKEMI